MMAQISGRQVLVAIACYTILVAMVSTMAGVMVGRVQGHSRARAEMVAEAEEMRDRLRGAFVRPKIDETSGRK